MIALLLFVSTLSFILLLLKWKKKKKIGIAYSILIGLLYALISFYIAFSIDTRLFYVTSAIPVLLFLVVSLIEER